MSPRNRRYGRARRQCLRNNPLSCFEALPASLNAILRRIHFGVRLFDSGHLTHSISAPLGGRQITITFYQTVELVNALEQEKTNGKVGQLAERLVRYDLVILDELGYLPFSASGGALLFHLLCKLYERANVVIATNLSFSEWAGIFGDAKMTTALLDRLTIIATSSKPATTASGSRPARP